MPGTLTLCMHLILYAMQLMYKLDQHPSCDKLKAQTDFRSQKDVDLIAMNRP
jgi:hypothetical protein